MNKIFSKLCVALTIAAVAGTGAHAQTGFKTEEYPMMKGVSKNIKNGWSVRPLITVGETNNNGDDVNLQNLNYRPAGIMDGIGAFRRGVNVEVYVNNELADNQGYTYYLANGTPLIGARIFNVEINRSSRSIKDAGLAYDEVFDRAGNFVTSATQINEGSAPGTNNGFNRFCSSYLVEAGYNGFTKNIYFTGEETSTEGQLTALDIAAEELHVVPMAGRAAWENVTSLENYGSNKVVIMIGDDRGGAPLILYVGEKNTTAPGYNPMRPFLKNNGLANGHLYVWVSDVEGETTPETFHGTGASRTGKFVRIEHYDPSMAGVLGYDFMGFASQATQDVSADSVGHFQFSRPEDLSTNPEDLTQVVLASTGLSTLFGGVDSWGTTYLIDVDDTDLATQLYQPLNAINNISATLTILYDGNDAGNGIVAGPDFGIRSPDNLDWADNGLVYIQEDKSFDQFGLTSGIEASVWQLNPENGSIERILEMDRNAVPFMQEDTLTEDIGNWESSGVLDVTSLFITKPGETLLIMDVQAHSITAGPIGESTDLVQGGQLFLASKIYTGPIAERTASDSKEINKTTSRDLTGNPNPAADVVVLNKTCNVQLFDLNGKLMFSRDQVNKIDVSKLQAGVYILETDQNEKLKIVIQ